MHASTASPVSTLPPMEAHAPPARLAQQPCTQGKLPVALVPWAHFHRKKQAAARAQTVRLASLQRQKASALAKAAQLASSAWKPTGHAQDAPLEPSPKRQAAHSAAHAALARTRKIGTAQVASSVPEGFILHLKEPHPMPLAISAPQTLLLPGQEEQHNASPATQLALSSAVLNHVHTHASAWLSKVTSTDTRCCHATAHRTELAPCARPDAQM
jgi:hypothetical protein